MYNLNISNQMARINSILGKINGKVGNMVFASTGGEVVAREYNPNVSNPNTTAQVDQRAKLKLMSQIAAALAPVIVIPKEGLKSSRNLFIKKNFDKVSAESGIAQVTYENLQITAGNAALPAIHILRSQQAGVEVNLEERADAAVSRVVYILYKKTSEKTLQYVQSVIAEDATLDGTFKAQMYYTEGDIVVFAYGMKDLSGKASAKYSDYAVQNGLDVARLAMSRQLSLKDYQFTQTRGTTLFAGESESTTVPDGYARIFVTALGPGSVAGAGVFEIGTQVTVTATPDTGKFFRGWKDNGSDIIVSNDATYTFELTGQVDLVAVFSDTEAPVEYHVNVVNANPNLGTVNLSGEQIVLSGQSIHLVAEPTGMNNFDGWFVGADMVSGSETFDYTPTGNGTIAARFSEFDEA